MTSRIKLGPPDYVVLGMIRQGAGSGYAIKRAVEESIRSFWTISRRRSIRASSGSRAQAS